MAILLNGLFGGFSGKIGGVIGYCINGKQYVRQVSSKRTARAPSQQQLKQQKKFALAIAFLKQASPFLNALPKRQKQRIDHSAEAKSHILKYAFLEDADNLKIHYKSVKLCNGRALDASTEFDADQTGIQFRSELKTDSRFKNGQLSILAYFPDSGQWMISSANFNNDQAIGQLKTSTNGRPYSVETYILCVSADGKTASESVYTGSYHSSFLKIKNVEVLEP